jgi:hypothetical protein
VGHLLAGTAKEKEKKTTFPQRGIAQQKKGKNRIKKINKK